jgi:hypothetical protein
MPHRSGVRASVVKEWDDIARTPKIEPRVCLSDTEEQTFAWGRSLASCRRIAEAAACSISRI